MKKFNFKSRKGFTLIELLVVIGILAVLAAIAIPSVAGLIDRANVSADNTNANEMTNAMERFASEYELYCQDIASGTLDVNNLDSAQGRVYNVTGVTTREEITALESDGFNGIKINRDTKYPENADTVKAIAENYTKTSSSTFEPKQSDMHYWYSPDCGIIVVAEPNSTIAQKNDLIISGKDAKGNELDDNAEEWIDVTIECGPLDLSTINTNLSTNTWEEIKKVSKAGMTAEAGWTIGSTKSVRINGKNVTATLIGINHDGDNTTTWMVTTSGGIGSHVINSTKTSNGGWENSEVRQWLNNDVYNTLSEDVKNSIKTVNKISNNTGNNVTSVSTTSDKLFLLSAIEIGLKEDNSSNHYSDLTMKIINMEGTTYAFFENNPQNNWTWLRSSPNVGSDGYWLINNNSAILGMLNTTYSGSIRPAFTIG